MSLNKVHPYSSERKAAPDDRLIAGSKDEKVLKINLIIHPCLESDQLIMIYPACGEGLDGYKNRYRKIAELITEKKLGAVILIDNQQHPGFIYAHSVVDDLRRVISDSIKRAEMFCASASPKITLVGLLDGANACASIAADFSQIKNLILLNLIFDGESRDIIDCFHDFSGSMYIGNPKENLLRSNNLPTESEIAALYTFDNLVVRRNVGLCIHNSDIHLTQPPDNGRCLSQLIFSGLNKRKIILEEEIVKLY